MATSYETRLATAPEEGIKAPCVVASIANLTLSGAQTVNGTAVVAGDRVLVKSQTDTTENGIYDVAASAWTRATDFNAANDVVSGMLVLDTANKDIYEASFTGSWTPDTTAITFSNFSASDSANVTYTPLGTGAVATTVQAILRTRISLFDFGVTGTGTDEATGFQAAMDHAVTNNRTLFIPVPTVKYTLATRLTIADGTSLRMLGENRETTVLEFTSTSLNGIECLGESDSLIIEHINIKHLTTSTGTAIYAPAGSGQAIRDVHINHVACESFDNGIEIGNALNCKITNIWRMTGNSVSSGTQVGDAIQLTANSGSPTDATIEDVYFSNYDRGITSEATRVYVQHVIPENFSDYAFYAKSSCKMTIHEASPATGSGFSATNLYKRDDGAYMKVHSTRTGFSNITTPFNVGTNGRFTYLPEKVDNVIAFASVATSIGTKATNFYTFADWDIIQLNKDTTALSTVNYGEDSEGNFNTTTYQYTTNFPGKYILSAQGTWDVRYQGTYAIGIFVDGAQVGMVGFASETEAMGKEILSGTNASYNAPNITAGSFTSQDVTVTGANLSDAPTCVASLGIDTTDLSISANLTADDTVTVVINNNSGSGVDLAAAVLNVICFAPMGVTLRTLSIPAIPVYLSKGQTVELRGWHDASGGSQSVIASHGDEYDHTDNTSNTDTADPPHPTFLAIHGPVE